MEIPSNKEKLAVENVDLRENVIVLIKGIFSELFCYVEKKIPNNEMSN